MLGSSLVNLNPYKTADLFTFSKKNFHGKLYFLGAVIVPNRHQDNIVDCFTRKSLTKVSTTS